MRKLITPLIHGIPATTHGPPTIKRGSYTSSLRLPGKTAGPKDLIYNDPLKPTARVPNRFMISAGNLGETRTAIDFGALLGHVTAGRASAPVVRAIA